MVATAILCAFSVYEIYRATGTIENEVMFTVSMLIAVLAAFVHIPRSEIVLTVAFIFATVASIWLMIRQKHCSLDSPVKAFFIVLLIIVLFKAIPELRSLNSGLYYLIFAVTLCFVTDVAAYLIGRGLGRHKLMPKVSPNKTIEGSLGGLLFGVLLALLGGIVVEKFVKIEVNYGTLALWALMTSVVGQFGDLSMSVIKRICGIKDYGNLLPGHGGILDRFDSHLTEMDGFEGNNGVIILAATNRPESLDPALTRPGRFDRRVPVELPDLAGREAILKVHAKKIKTADNVDFHTIARMASGTSGAELANIINEAALRAVRSGRTVVEQADLEESIEVVIAGYQKKNAIMTDDEKKVVAYHEIGHALVAALQTASAPVQKITIIPRTSGALGYTMQVEQNDKVLMTKEELENKIATLTGGRAAEEIVFGQITTGASNDIEQATKLARAMITRYGMTDEFDMVAMETVSNQYLGGDTSLACSADTQKEIDQKVVETVKKQHEKARRLLADNRKKLDELASYLYEKETITGSEFMTILNRKDGNAV